MSFFRHLISQRLPLFAMLFLALSLTCVQSAQLHLHVYDHVDDSHAHASHETEVHANYEPNIDHGDQSAQLELTEQGLVKSLLSDLPVIALFTVLILCCLLLALRWQRWPILNPLPCLRSFSVTPPLRAPPSITL